MAMETKVVLITPEMAKSMLAKNMKNNRPVLKGTVHGYARQMRNGKWKLTHQGIAFDENGELVRERADQSYWIGDSEVNLRDCTAEDAEMIYEDGTKTGEKFSDVKQNYFIPETDVAKAYRIVYNYNPYQGASMLVDRKWVQNYLF